MIRERQVFPPLEPGTSASTDSARTPHVPETCVSSSAEQASVDPPLLPIGAGSVRAPEANHQDGGVTGVTHASAWDAICGQPATMSDLLDFLKELDENPDLRAAAFLRSLGRLRDEIDRVPEEAPMDSPVVLKLQDATVLAKALMSRLR